MIKNNYEVRAQKFIEQICPYLEEYGVFSVKTGLFASVSEALYAFNTEKKRKVRWFHGSTRIVLATSDYVVKFDYIEDSWYGNSETELSNWENVYSQCDYADHFAPISKYTCEGYNFYIMPRIRNVGRFAEDELNIDEDFRDWAYDNIGDIHDEQFGKVKGKIVFVDYADTHF